MTIDTISEWKKVETLAEETARQFTEAPDVMLILGSGLGRVADKLEGKVSVPAEAFEDLPKSTVQGHAGMLHQGRVGEKTVLVQQGRVHLYEGYTPAEVVRSIRAAVLRGASVVVLTNAAGGIDPTFRRGSLMLIDDHVNLTGTSPLLGPNPDERGQRFPDMSSAYDPDLRAKLRVAAAKLGIDLQNGVYAGMLGPTYETPAEVRMLKILGARAVGMSTVQEVIAARHMKAKVAGISCITNLAAGLSQAILSHEEVGEIGDEAVSDLAKLLLSFLEDLP
jgi:purine-nucleoside phosphorylase